MKTLIKPLLLLMFTLIISCNSSQNNKVNYETDENGFIVLSDEEVEDIVKRSYQYVAMYNVNQKMALAEEGMTTRGYNKGFKNTNLLDHTARFIARPNNDVLYQLGMLDLRQDAIIIEFPAIDSKYVSLMATGYDHYVNIPLSTVDGDFKKPTKILFYTERTKNYDGIDIDGIDEKFLMTGDFISLVLRVMPHANEPEKFKKISEQIHEIRGLSLSEYQGKNPVKTPETKFPSYGKTDADIFENNLLEVMQFVFNHTTFDPNFELDKAVLDRYKKLGVEPGKDYDPATTAKIDGKKFKEVSLKVKDEAFAVFNDPVKSKEISKKMFLLKGSAGLDAILMPSVVGPIGQPAKEALYPPVLTKDGSSLNAMNDYKISLSKEELPPAKAFWSFTLYDKENGFFIPNDHKKYSVGENSGMKLNEEGGIDIYISAEKPEGVPEENWLPINRENLEMDIILRIYAPDLEKMKDWKAPLAERI
ncbi:DUF1214 domain-containing protein [Marinigracilibium pacificum]|uniref:DUF1254 domain-containing protein n=1 Tax=Marinigracilibium pacificum TaxID=2729599 RepID=A0A848IW99_9BACT|nr:DUF1214 domain-containing protein [Marinigracilibium pacificum]NMM47438.1 DUF1254 domain-containing protein [Marinigracilibium pacificum]